MSTTTGDWAIVRAVRNWRVWNISTGQYHRGSDRCVRVYAGEEAAQARRDKLNAARE